MREYIENFLQGKGLKLEDLRDISNKSFRNELIKKLIEKSNLSKRKIALELGLNREVVRKSVIEKQV